MTTPNTGFGDSQLGGPWIGGYGDHPHGYGHPVHLVLEVVGGPEKGDLGGEVVEVQVVGPGQLPPGPYQVLIGGVVCYSGVQLGGNDIHPSANLQKFRCIMPNLYKQLGTKDIIIKGGFGTIVMAAAITVVRYVAHVHALTFALRFPRGSNPVWYLPIARPRAGEV